jgi:CRP/FNR family transcriptional regulator, cyclic AMP receptor protein
MAGKSKSGLTPTLFLKQAGPGKSIRVYRDKEAAYLQGSPANAVFYIQSGMVKLTVASRRDRRKAVLAVLQEGDFFGEGCLGSERRRMSTATSIGQSTITRAEKAVFRKELDRDPEFAAMFTDYLLSEIVRLKADLADHFFNFSERRLARILLTHRGFTQTSKSGSSSLHLSQTTLAEMVGTTRGRVSRFMNEFRVKGYIRYNGGLEIDSERLAAFLEG